METSKPRKPMTIGIGSKHKRSRPKRAETPEILAYRRALGTVIAEHRRRRGISQRKMARDLGYGWITITKREAGLIRITADELFLYAQYLGTTVKSLLPPE